MGDIGQFLPFILMFVVVYFFMIAPQMKRAKKEKKFAAELKKGGKIITKSGLHGKILELGDKDNTCIIETMSGKVKFERSAISMELSSALNAPPAKKKYVQEKAKVTYKDAAAFPDESLLLSGWILGDEILRKKSTVLRRLASSADTPACGSATTPSSSTNNWFTATANRETIPSPPQAVTHSAMSRNTPRTRRDAIQTDCSPCLSLRVSSARSRGASTTQAGHCQTWFGRRTPTSRINQYNRPRPMCGSPSLWSCHGRVAVRFPARSAWRLPSTSKPIPPVSKNTISSPSLRCGSRPQS